MGEQSEEGTTNLILKVLNEISEKLTEVCDQMNDINHTLRLMNGDITQ